MKTERESFDLWFKKNFHDLHEAICCGDLVAKNYKKAMFKAWQASAQREGYRLAPLEPSEEMIDCVYDEDGDYVASIDGSPESFYKAMINAV